jgi:sugar lactone lactonase YvrE
MIALVTPDGPVRRVADGIAFPNGMTGVGPFGDSLVGRVGEGGEVLERVRLDASCFACMLGGEDRRTLFMPTADWRMNESFEDNIARLTAGPRTGRLLTAPAPASGVGWP